MVWSKERLAVGDTDDSIIAKTRQRFEHSVPLDRLNVFLISGVGDKPAEEKKEEKKVDEGKAEEEVPDDGKGKKEDKKDGKDAKDVKDSKDAKDSKQPPSKKPPAKK